MCRARRRDRDPRGTPLSTKVAAGIDLTSGCRLGHGRAKPNGDWQATWDVTRRQRAKVAFSPHSTRSTCAMPVNLHSGRRGHIGADSLPDYLQLRGVCSPSRHFILFDTPLMADVRAGRTVLWPSICLRGPRLRVARLSCCCALVGITIKKGGSKTTRARHAV